MLSFELKLGKYLVKKTFLYNLKANIFLLHICKLSANEFHCFRIQKYQLFKYFLKIFIFCKNKYYSWESWRGGFVVCSKFSIYFLNEIFWPMKPNNFWNTFKYPPLLVPNRQNYHTYAQQPNYTSNKPHIEASNSNIIF